jgi:ketosteroid isomerase-like protein
MKTLFLQILLACACAAPVLANSTEAAAAKDANDIAAIRQLSIDMGDAMVAGDAGKLDQMFADSWVALASSGKTVTKENMLRDFKTGKDKLESFELSPIDVQVYGNVAVAHGGVTEKRNRNGQDTSGQYVWMDLLEKRDGKWLVVQSAGHPVK